MMEATNRYLFVTMEGGGNVAPVLTAARALVARGHDVRVLTEPCLRDAVQAAGARFEPFTRYFTRTDRRQDIFLDWQASSPPKALQSSLRHVILGPAEHVVADVEAAVEREPVDALVVDWLMPGALIVAEARGIQSAVLLHCTNMLPAPGRPPGPLPPARGALGRLRDRVGWGLFRRLVGQFGPGFNALRRGRSLPPLDNPIEQYDRADRVLVQTSEAFDFVSNAGPGNVRYVGPALDDPDWLSDARWQSPFAPDDTRPLVVASLSSTFQDQRALLQTTIDALGRLAVRGLVTLGPAMAGERFEVPGNVRVVESAPHLLLFEEAAAFITHCGHGSVMRALSRGVPLVALPMGRDQDGNATRIVRRGLGLKARKSATGIARAVQRVLGEPRYRQAAREMAERLRQDADDDRLTRELEGLVDGEQAPAVAAAG